MASPRVWARFAFAAAALFGGAAHAAQGDNIALGKPVTMSGSNGDPTLAGANCTDGNTNGNYPTDRICWTGSTQTGTNREWIEVDLGQDYIIDRVRLSNRTDGGNGDLARWIVLTTRPSSLTGVTSSPQSTLDPALNPSAPFVNKIAYAAGTNAAGGGYGTGQGNPWTSLDMKVGTHIARYVRIYTMKASTTLNLAEIEVFEGAPPSRTILNPSFEQPALATGNAQVSETLVPGWSTTDSVAVPNAGFGTPFLTGGNIELWRSGFGGVLPDEGNQFVELNAFINGALSPAPLCVYPGETFTWRVSHRARGAAGAVDVARLRINGQDIATLSDGTVQADPHTCTPTAGFTCSAQAGSPTAAGWGRWQGSWTNSLTQPKAMTFEFAAISSASGSPGAGNFIDNVSITGLTAAVEFSTSSATGPESVASANLPQLLVNGPVASAQTLELEIVGGSAVRGSDYTTNPTTGTIVVTIPAGNYDGTAATAISLAPYLQIATDSAVEGAETIVLRLRNASAGLSLAGASGCRTGIADSTYTITDEAVPTLGKTFAPDTIPYGGVATLTFLIDNSGAASIDRPIAFTDNLATGLQIADPANGTTTCGGTITAAPGDSRVAFAGGTVVAGGFCTVTVDVTNRPGFSGLCYNPNFANENQNLVGLQNLIAQIQQFTCVSVTPPDCPDSATTNGFGNISGLSPNLNNGISGQCVAVQPTIQLTKISQNAVGSFGFTLGNTSATNPVTITTTAPGAPGTSSAVFDVLDISQPVTLAESLPANWVLSGITCQLADGTPIGSFDAPSATWTIAPSALAYGQQIGCTITNIADRLDFGDAPDSYGTLLASNGARHTLVGYDVAAGTAPLMLGVRVDHESDGFPGAAADGDDTNGIDDEDAFFGPIALQPGSTAVSLDVPLTNTSGGNANLYAWIDFDGNGRFDVGEAGNCPSVATAATQATCTWTAPAPLTDGFQTYARFRLTTQTLAAGTAPSGGDARAQGAAADGEVEDHRVSVATVLPLTCEAPFVETFGSYAVTPGAVSGWGPALPAGTTTYAFQSGANFVDAGQYGLVTRSILGNPAWQDAPDHTPGDTDGYMMIVNGDPSPGIFYRHTFSGLAIGARYNFFASLANIVAGFGLGLPDVTLRVVDPATNAVLASFNTGGLPEGTAGTMPWLQQQLVFTATQTTVRVELANNSGVAGGNDVALDDIGFAQVCELGDAPDSYGTLNASNGAGHLFPGPGLSLGGGLPDGELDGQPSPNADGDDLNGIDDENAFPSGAPSLIIAAPYALTVPVETTAGDATACAWVDFDQNGSFSAAEGQCQALTAGATVSNFSWPAAATAALSSGRTYLRLRIERNSTFPANLSTADFVGSRGPGEVEDYVVPVFAPANVTLVKALTGESGTHAGQAESGEQLTYTITLSNSGGVPATNYGVTDTLDPNVSFVSASNGGAAAGAAVTWAGLTVPANGTLSLTVVVQVANPIPAGVTQIGNVAYETGTVPPTCPPAGGQCVIVPTAPKVAISKALTGESGTQAGRAEPGEQLTYTITLNNSGGSDATNFGVTDTLDPNVSFVSASNGGTAAGAAVTWAGLTVPANGTLTVTVVVQVANPIPNGVAQIANVAYETGTVPPACPPAGGQCVIVPTAPKVAIVKKLAGESGSLPGFAEAGEQLTYTITLSNSGGTAATNYGVTDTLDPNVTFVSADNSGSAAGATVTWAGLTVPAGGSLTLTVVVKVVDPLPANVTQIGNVAYETGTVAPSCPPAGGQCVIVPTIHLPLACTEQDTRATQRWWFFGTRGGIDFGVSGTTATALRNPSNIVTPEGSTVVTDSAGQLQFWSNAKVAYTRNQTPMPNGSGLLGNDSATQTVAAFPAIGHAGRYFIVTTDTDVGAAPNGQLRYSVVDMTLNGGLGDIVAGQKNIALGAPNTASEALTAVPNADGTGFWVLTATNNAPTLLAYAFDDNGPVGAPVASTLSTNNGNWYGSLYFDKKLRQLAQAASDRTGSGQLRVLNFDGASGHAFERYTWRPSVTGVPAVSVLYTADFSPAGDYVYASRIFGGGRLYRYRIAGANTSGDIAATEEFLGATGTVQGGHVRRGADDRMYIPGNLGGTALNVVNTPDDPTNAGYVAGGYPLAAGSTSSFGLPQTVTGCPLPTAADLSIVKTASTPAPTGTPNQYAITYVVTVANAGGSSGSYDLGDTLSFNGATVTAVSAPAHASATGDPQNGTLGAFGAPNGGSIVTGETLAANGSETWTYTVTYTITDADVAADCSTPSGGLRNHALLGGAATGAPPADTCSGAPSVNIVKTAAAPVPTGAANQFTLTYTVDIANSGSLPGRYDLADTLSFNGATVNAISAPAYSSSSGDTQDGTLGTFAPPSGGGIVSGETITAGGAERWTYTVTYTVTDATAAQDCANPAGGLRNDAQLGGSLVGESTTCTGAPAVVIGKSASGPVPTGTANEYALDYLVSVQNNGSLAGTYDLADTFTYAGVNVVSVSAITHGGGDPLSAPLGTLGATGGSIVSGETIAAGASETYAYRVVFSVTDVAAIGSCASGGGLKNLAALGGSASGQVDTCSDVPNLVIAKTAGAPTPTGTPHQYSIAYLVTVSNNGAAAGFYDLTDAFAFAGATVDAVSAITHGGSDPLTTPLGTLTAAGGSIVTAEPIAPAANETYAYTVTFTVTDADAAADCANPAGGLRNRAALGGSASGDAPTCTSAPNVDIAKALTGESGALAGQAEPGEQLTYTITLTNSGGSAATAYGVSDTLDPNVSFVSADNGGTAAAGVVSWSGLTVPANGTLTLTVVVQVASPIPPGVAQIGNVAYETGTTPPACPPAGGQCVIVPTAPSVTIAKALTGESGTLAGQAEPGEQLTYTITLTNSGGSAATNYGVTDTLDPNVSFVSASNGGVAAGASVTWSGLTVPANGTLSLTVVVRVVDPLPAGVTQVANVAYQTGTVPPACPPAGAQCVIVPSAPQVRVSKSASAPAPTGTPNQYEITYVVSVHNGGGSVGRYDLADTLSFNGATVGAISAPIYSGSAGQIQDGTLGSIGAPNGGSIVTNESIGAQGTETWTYTVTYVVDDADVAADCSSPSGGLRNHAALGGASTGAPAADTCTGAASVNIVKTATAPVPTGTPNQFTLTYTVAIANSGSLAGRYDLADTLSFNGATVNAVSTPAYSSGSGDTQDGTLGTFTAPSGGSIVSGESISAGGAESWSYTVTYTVTDPATAQDCTNPSGGLRNQAELGGSLVGESTTCTGAAAVVIGKSASGPTPTGNPNEYRLTYLVNVQNNGTLPGSYDLSDTFTFAGVSSVVVSAVQHGGSDPLAGTLGTLGATGGSIVVGESIAAAADENYTYSVTFTVDDAAVIGSCSSGGGLRNQAQLGGSSAGQVGTCSEVPDVSVSKSASGPTPTGTPNQYTLVYTVAVSNAGGAEGSYDLADAFAFAGATIDSVSAVTHAGPDPLSSTLGTLTPSGGTIVTGETIAAGGSESYSYTVTFTLTDPALADDCANPNGGLRNAAALGGSASGDARTCTGTPLLAIVKTLSGESGSVPGVAEPGEQLTYTITLTNSGASAALDQDITDRLDPNVTFVSADNGGVLVGGNVQWTGLTVPAGGSLALSVTVRVADPIAAGVTSIGNVAYDPSIGPPDCTATPRPDNCTVTPTPSVVTIVKALAGESGSLPGVAEPGEQLSYTITLTNTGGSDATGYGVTDVLDPNTSFVSADNGGTAAAGAVTWSGLTVPANGQLVLTVVVRVVDPIPAGVSQLANVAYQTGTPQPSCPPAGSQCVVTPTVGAVVIAKALVGESGSQPGVAEPGEELSYTITLTNTGGSAVTGYAVSDRLDPNTSFVSASNGGTFAAGVVGWSGLDIPANGTLSLSVVVRVADPLPAGVSQVANVAYQTGTTPPSCPPAGSQCVVTPTAGAVTIAKSVIDANGNGQAEPGETLTYTIVLSNSGGSAVSNYGVTDPLDANTVFVSADNGGSHAGGVVSWSGLTIPANSSLNLTVVVRVVDPVPAGVTEIGNVAYQTGTTPPDCTAIPQPANCVVIVVPPVTGTPQLSITKSANTNVLQPGGSVVYTITVRSVGNADATGVVVSDPIPLGLDAYAWTCAASGGVACPNASGSGAISESVPTFPVGASLVYTVTATVSADPPASVVNTATVTPSDIATCAPSGTAPPCPATVVVVVETPNVALPVPTTRLWALLLIGFGLLGLGWYARRRLD